MAHDVLKLITVVAILALVIGLVALFASGYISAFKPGGVAGGKNASVGVSGGARSGGTVSGKAAQPKAPMASLPASVSPYGEMPPGYVEPQPTAYAQPPVNVQPPAGQLQAPEYAQGPQPPYPERNVSPATEMPERPPREVSPIPTPVAQPMAPGAPQLAEEWQAIIEQLFQLLSLIFSGRCGCMPQWPSWPQYYPQFYPVSLK